MLKIFKKGQSVNSEDGEVVVVSSKRGVVEYATDRKTTVSTSSKNVTAIPKKKAR